MTQGSSRDGSGVRTPLQQPWLPERREIVVQRTVLEVDGAKWPVLAPTNYCEWAVLMKVKLRARKLWHVIEVGTKDEE